MEFNELIRDGMYIIEEDDLRALEALYQFHESFFRGYGGDLEKGEDLCHYYFSNLASEVVHIMAKSAKSDRKWREELSRKDK